MAATRYIYKIITESDWRDLQEGEAWRGTELDRRDGYVHLSTEEQVSGTLTKHYRGQEGLRLLRICTTSLPDLRWEVSRGGALFPHLYGPLLSKWVDAVYVLMLSETGEHHLDGFELG